MGFVATVVDVSPYSHSIETKLKIQRTKARMQDVEVSAAQQSACRSPAVRLTRVGAEQNPSAAETDRDFCTDRLM